ncbi:MAG: DNA-3-methyladenine glycosylase family protein, partial [Limisphaerales bacterium]
MRTESFLLEPLSPFRLDLTVWVLRRRPDNVVDRWDGHTYRRVVPLPAGPIEVAVTQIGLPESPQMRVSVNAHPRHSKLRSTVTVVLERLLGLRIDLARFNRFAARQGQLRQLTRRFRGMKPPRFTTVFESVINAIASQQVTRTLGIRLLNRLAASYGAAVRAEGETAYALPRSEELAALRPADLRRVGFSRQKGRAMVELANSINEGGPDLEALAKLPDAEALEHLRGLRGVGSWTAEYVMLRGLGGTHIFPRGVAGVRNNLQRYLRQANPVADAAARRTLERWHLYGGLIYFYLLLDRLSEEGFLPTEAAPPQAGAGNHVDTRQNIHKKHLDEKRIQSWGSCGVELGGGPRPRSY